MSWFDDLQPASFRGIPFGVLGGESRHGRRVAVHEYPNRDRPYVEDLGRSTRRISLVGFLVEDSIVYGGGSAIAQRIALTAAAEQAGPGILVHPTLGELRVSIPDGGLGVMERWDAGRYFELSFSFIEAGDRLFPSVSASSQSLVDSLIDKLGLASAADFVASLTRTVNLGLGIVRGVISLGNAVVARVVSTAAGFQVLTGQASRDATNLANLSSLLTGSYGRYQSANVTSAFANGKQSSGVTPTTIATLTAQGAEGRAAVATASAALSGAVSALDASSVQVVPTASANLTSALATTTLNPGDAIRIFSGLSAYSPDPILTTGQTGAAMTIAEAAMAAQLRRCALGELARAAVAYMPSSYDDAVAVRGVVTDAIDAEILVAGDAGDDASFLALREVRQAIVDALTAAGSDLSALKDFSLNAPSPALALAQRLYQDAGRSDELVAEAQPIHPAFMPARFRALAR
jgi:prophage DNA circulation protein